MQAPAMAIRSLTARVLAVSTVWAVVALVVIGVVISALYGRAPSAAFRTCCGRQLYNVINSTLVDEKAALSGARSLRPALFPAADGLVLDRRADRRIRHAAADIDLARHGRNCRSSASTRSPSISATSGSTPPRIRSETRWRWAETEVVLDIQGHAARFRVAGPIAMSSRLT